MVESEISLPGIDELALRVRVPVDDVKDELTCAPPSGRQLAAGKSFRAGSCAVRVCAHSFLCYIIIRSRDCSEAQTNPTFVHLPA